MGATFRVRELRRIVLALPIFAGRALFLSHFRSQVPVSLLKRTRQNSLGKQLQGQTLLLGSGAPREFSYIKHFY